MSNTSRLYIFPLAVAVLFPITFAFTYALAVKYGHIKAFYSYISDTGATTPEMCYFAQLLNIAAVLIGISAYIRYKQVEEVFRTTKVSNPSLIKMNKVGLFFGCLAGFGVSVVGCFQETHIILAHVIGAFMAFLGGSIFMMIEGFLTLHTMPVFGSRGLAYFRMIDGFFCAALFVLSFTTGIISIRQFTGEVTLLWEPEDGGWTLRVLSTVTEWVMAALLDIYFITFIPEFQKIAFEGPQFRIVEVATIHQKSKNGTSSATQQKVLMQRIDNEDRS